MVPCTFVRNKKKRFDDKKIRRTLRTEKRQLSATLYTTVATMTGVKPSVLHAAAADDDDGDNAVSRCMHQLKANPAVMFINKHDVPRSLYRPHRIIYPSVRSSNRKMAIINT